MLWKVADAARGVVRANKALMAVRDEVEKVVAHCETPCDDDEAEQTLRELFSLCRPRGSPMRIYMRIQIRGMSITCLFIFV